MNKNYLIIVLLFFCSILNAQNLNIVYIGNSITEGALLKNPKTEAAPIRASQYLDKHLNGKVTFRNCGVSGMTTLNFLPISGQQFPNVKQQLRNWRNGKGNYCFPFRWEPTTVPALWLSVPRYYRKNITQT